MRPEYRLEATKYIWIAFGGAMALMMLNSAAIEQPLGISHVLIALFLGVFAFVSTGTIWNWGDIESEAALESQGKSKRQQEDLDAMISRLSDDEREDLMQRLADEQSEIVGLTDDGELVRR